MLGNSHFLPNYFQFITHPTGARGKVVGWGTMLEAGRSRIRFPMRSLDFFNWSNPSSRTMALGSTQPLTEMSARNIPGGKGRPVRKALTFPRPVAGIAFHPTIGRSILRVLITSLSKLRERCRPGRDAIYSKESTAPIFRFQEYSPDSKQVSRYTWRREYGEIPKRRLY
jgi:hypothetical protein